MESHFIALSVLNLILVGSANEATNLLLNVKKNENGTLSLSINWENTENLTITGYKIYFSRVPESRREDIEWISIEYLTSSPKCQFLLDPYSYPSIASFSVDSFAIQLKAVGYVNQAALQISPIVTVGGPGEDLESRLEITNQSLLGNGSLLLQFSTNRRKTQQMIVLYQEGVLNSTFDIEDSNWTSIDAFTIYGTQIMLDLPSNRTYLIMLQLRNTTSNIVTVSIPPPAAPPIVNMIGGSTQVFDPDPNLPLSLSCSAYNPPPYNITWLVNDEAVPADHPFYTVHTVLGANEGVSTISAKARIRSENVTCVAIGPNGGMATASSLIDIRGPGSPPSMITLVADGNGWFNVQWQPPIYPNGDLKGYVLYYTLLKDLPLSDWRKVDFGGEANTTRISAEGGDLFIRLQAVSSSGPGLISPPIPAQRESDHFQVDKNEQ